MLQEILGSNLKVVFVGTALAHFAEDIGFYYMHPKDRFWELLEYAGIIDARTFPKKELKALRDTHAAGRLNESLRLGFFWRKEAQLLKLGIGLTDLNRREPVIDEEDPAAVPTNEDIKQFVKKMQKLKPRLIAFITDFDIFEQSFRALYPQATKNRGRQEFMIGDADVWLMGTTSGRPRSDAEREQVFEDLAERLKQESA
jgi:G:T/U-mismatch repair DNA glycosylase